MKYSSSLILYFSMVICWLSCPIVHIYQVSDGCHGFRIVYGKNVVFPIEIYS